MRKGRMDSSTKNSDFKDHFSGHADIYARYRPSYPQELFEYLRSLSPSDNLAWDCATGSGQTAVGLAKLFKKVCATDASEAQLKQAQPRENIEYSVSKAESTQFKSKSFDLICVSQAAHWFQLEDFYNECKRLLNPGGIIAVWCYQKFRIDDQVDSIIDELYSEVLAEFWPPERLLVDEGYQNISFPFTKINTPKFQISVEWHLDQVMGYLSTWSACQKYYKAKGNDPLDLIKPALCQAWQSDALKKTVKWPISLLVGKVDF